MTTVDNSKNNDYYSQRNNELNPQRACNVTSMINAIVSCGWDLPPGPHKQPEDNLMEFINSNPTVLKVWDKIDPNHITPPNEWYGLIVLGTNLWLGIENEQSKISLSWMVTIPALKDWIDFGGCAVVNGRFKTMTSYISHMTAIVGYQESMAEIKNFIMDDPYGDWRTKYRNTNGNNSIIAIDDFISHIQPLNQKNKMVILVPKKNY